MKVTNKYWYTTYVQAANCSVAVAKPFTLVCGLVHPQCHTLMQPRSQALKAEEGAPGTHCLRMRLISQKFVKIVYLQDILRILVASDVDGCH